jgi:hypothetical protein
MFNERAAPILYSRVIVDDINLFFYGFDESIVSTTSRKTKRQLFLFITHINFLSPWLGSQWQRHTSMTLKTYEACIETFTKRTRQLQSLSTPPFPRLQAVTEGVTLFNNDAASRIDLLQDAADMLEGDVASASMLAEARATIAFVKLLYSWHPPSICSRVCRCTLVQIEMTAHFRVISATPAANYIHVFRPRPLSLFWNAVNILFCNRTPIQSRTRGLLYPVSLAQIQHYLYRIIGEILVELEETQSSRITGLEVKLYGEGLGHEEIRQRVFASYRELWVKEDRSYVGWLDKQEDRLKEIITLHAWEDRPVCPGCDGFADE